MRHSILTLDYIAIVANVLVVVRYPGCSLLIFDKHAPLITFHRYVCKSIALRSLIVDNYLESRSR